MRKQVNPSNDARDAPGLMRDHMRAYCTLVDRELSASSCSLRITVHMLQTLGTYA